MRKLCLNTLTYYALSELLRTMTTTAESRMMACTLVLERLSVILDIDIMLTCQNKLSAEPYRELKFRGHRGHLLSFS